MMERRLKTRFGFLNRAVFLLVLSAFVTCCGDEDTEDTAVDKNDNGTGEKNGVGTDSEISDSAGVSTGDGADNQKDSPTTIAPQPIAFDIVNQGNSPLYIDEIWGLPPEFEEAFSVQIGPVVGGVFQPHMLQKPPCVDQCPTYDPDRGMCSCSMCKMVSSVTYIAPGESITLEWDGTFGVYDEDNPCCTCFETINPSAGPTRLQVCTYDAASCRSDCNAPMASGHHDNLDVVGDVTCHALDFELPYASDRMTFAITGSGTPIDSVVYDTDSELTDMATDTQEVPMDTDFTLEEREGLCAGYCAMEAECIAECSCSEQALPCHSEDSFTMCQKECPEWMDSYLSQPECTRGFYDWVGCVSSASCEDVNLFFDAHPDGVTATTPCASEFQAMSDCLDFEPRCEYGLE